MVWFKNHDLDFNEIDIYVFIRLQFRINVKKEESSGSLFNQVGGYTQQQIFGGEIAVKIFMTKTMTLILMKLTLIDPVDIIIQNKRQK